MGTILEHFSNILEEVANANNLSDTPGNIFNTDESGIQINNKSETVITEKASKNVHVLTSEGKKENITVILCCFVFQFAIQKFKDQDI